MHAQAARDRRLSSGGMSNAARFSTPRSSGSHAHHKQAQQSSAAHLASIELEVDHEVRDDREEQRLHRIQGTSTSCIACTQGRTA
jgi:hypothetical protein